LSNSPVDRFGSVSPVPHEYEDAVESLAPIWLDIDAAEVDSITSNPRVASIAHSLRTLQDHSQTLDPKSSDRDLDRKERKTYREYSRAEKALLRSFRSAVESALGRTVEFISPSDMAAYAFRGVEIRITEDSDSEQGGEK
jgi:hypothetical protein